ncbi:MAG: ParB N-terminal domain-containing protein [Goleter apudmare HA4340-LM2]|jgi:ParB-like chromosome segregation protein Spo0J|nr:ParB N-terminal domain-containing protein [Goleter apudmare HA4340-LM2]
MKLSTSLVAIKKITSSKPRSTFVDDDLEQAAKLILESEGVINPIVVRRTSLQSYEVVDGDFEYYAAARAREIDPRKGEMIGVFIIEDENEEALTKQVQLFRKAKDGSLGKVNFTAKDLENFLNNLESRFEKITKQLLEESTAKVKLENENKELKRKLADKVEPLAVFTKFEVDKIAKKLLNAGFNVKKANQVSIAVVDEREKEQFKSLNDVIERVKILHGKKMQKGISVNKMLDIIESLYLED